VESELITGKRLRFPPGHVEVRLTDVRRLQYRRLYAGYGSYISGLPVLRDRDFDGRPVRMTVAQLEALNRGLAELEAGPETPETVFSAQEQGRTRLFKRLQYLS
jgi:hypothetical protein